MTMDWLRLNEATGARIVARRAPDGDALLTRQPRDPLGWFRRFMLRRRADALLRQAVGPRRRGRPMDAREIPEHLRRDIGIPF